MKQAKGKETGKETGAMGKIGRRGHPADYLHAFYATGDGQQAPETDGQQAQQAPKGKER